MDLNLVQKDARKLKLKKLAHGLWLQYLVVSVTRHYLRSCRHKMLIGKVGSAKSFVNAERLPPTQSATKYHSLRSYYQICVWKCTESALNPSSWGWSESNGVYVPITMDLPPAHSLKRNQM